MNTTELYRIIEQKERHINSLESQNKELIVKNMDLQEQLSIPRVSQQRELLKSCFLALDEVSRDNAIITDEDAFIDEVIKDFNCG
jgi:hypothetical protein